jgi:hypothetical protein
MSRIISQLRGIITEILHLWREIASFKAISVPFAKREPAQSMSAIARNLNRRAKPLLTLPECLFGGKTVNVPNSTRSASAREA